MLHEPGSTTAHSISPRLASSSTWAKRCCASSGVGRLAAAEERNGRIDDRIDPVANAGDDLRVELPVVALAAGRLVVGVHVDDGRTGFRAGDAFAHDLVDGRSECAAAARGPTDRSARLRARSCGRIPLLVLPCPVRPGLVTYSAGTIFTSSSASPSTAPTSRSPCFHRADAGRRAGEDEVARLRAGSSRTGSDGVRHGPDQIREVGLSGASRR